MAVGCSSSPRLIIQTAGPVRGPVRRVSMLHNSLTPTHKPSVLQIRSSKITNKVFEDRSRGIICYRDDSGEIVCEGFDEGPRFRRQAPNPAYHRSGFREQRIIDLLQRSWFQSVEGDGWISSF